MKQKTRGARDTAERWPREIAQSAAAAPQKPRRWGRAVAAVAAGLLLIALLVPLGGGGLLSGCAVAAKALCPDCVVYGVEPEAGNDGQQSFRSGNIVHIDTPKTIADGAQTQHLEADQLCDHARRRVLDGVCAAAGRDALTCAGSRRASKSGFFTERSRLRCVTPLRICFCFVTYNPNFRHIQKVSKSNQIFKWH